MAVLPAVGSGIGPQGASEAIRDSRTTLRRVDGELTDVEGIRGAALKGDLSSALQRMAELGKLPLGGALPAPATPVASSLAGLPGPVADLALAVQVAAERVDEIFPSPAPPRVEPTRFEKVDGIITRATPGFAMPVAGKAEVGQVAAIAIGLAEAIERAIPVLRDRSAPSQASDSEVEGCDVLDQTPVLCIGSDGDNHYVDEQMLLIDLGGKDLYENSAGGGSASAAASGEGMPVSINIDVDGDDTYHHVARRDRYMASQGSSVYGIGVLLDLQGDDSYLRTSAGEGMVTLAEAQGSGAAGVGVLADLAGDDSYVVKDGGGCCSYHQGAANLGLGLLLDGGGTDNYELDAGSAEVAPGPDGALRGATGDGEGQGWATQGVGALVDSGGDNFFLAHGTASVPPIYHNYQEPLNSGAPLAMLQVIAQGVGTLGGTGLLLSGSGNDTFTVEGGGTGLAIQFAYGQGLSTDTGPGILHDLGGNDRYALRTRIEAERVTEVDASCGCARAEAVLDEKWFQNPQSLAGQGSSGSPGFGNTGTLGLLVDDGGDDRYEAALDGRTRTLAVGTEPGQEARATAVSLNGGEFRAQGAAEISGLGALVDRDGDDEYLTHLAVVAEAEARALDDDDEMARAHGLRNSSVDVLAQGATTGDAAQASLIDMGGLDSYAASLRIEAVATPTPGGATEDRNLGTVQGSGPQGRLVDVDDGALDTFVSEPNFLPMLEGRRGESPGWIEDAQYRPGIAYTSPLRPLGVGIVTSAAQKQAPQVVLDGAQPGPADGLVIVTGRLKDSTGSPIPGAYIDVRLEEEVPDLEELGDAYTKTWLSRVATHAVSGEDGTFTAILNIGEIEPTGAVRLFAGYSGATTAAAAVGTEALGSSTP